MQREKRLICPICKQNICAAGMRGHINGIARMEVYRWYSNRKLKMPHQKYIETHSTTKTITKIQI